MKTRRIAIKAFDHIVEMSFYVDFEQLIKQSLVSTEQSRKLYENLRNKHRLFLYGSGL